MLEGLKRYSTTTLDVESDSGYYMGFEVFEMENGPLFSSETEGGKHKILIDLDCDHVYVPSSTSGHGHLYVNQELPLNEYLRLLRVLADVNVISYDWYDVVCSNQRAFLRHPDMKKGQWAMAVVEALKSAMIGPLDDQV